MYYSHFFLTGCLVKKSCLYFLPNGSTYIILWLRVDKPFFSKGELKIERSEVPVKLFGEQAELWDKTIKKGSHISVEGEIRSFRWKGFNNKLKKVNYTAVELVATRIRLCEFVTENLKE